MFALPTPGCTHLEWSHPMQLGFSISSAATFLPLAITLSPHYSSSADFACIFTSTGPRNIAENHSCKHAVNSEAAKSPCRWRTKQRTRAYGGFKPLFFWTMATLQANPAGDLVKSSNQYPLSQSECGPCSPTIANWWALVLPPTQQHSFMVRFVSISDYTLLPPFFSRLCMSLFPLIFLVNRSFLPPSCLYQLIYNTTCLPALCSVGPAPSGILISTSKVDWSGVF